MKVTEVQVFDYSKIYANGQTAYSANVAIDDSFMVQWCTDIGWTIPHSDEACWCDGKAQDYAHKNYDAQDLAEKLGIPEIIQDFINRGVFENE
tara:strand:- start:1191 stop:1469 length:279 start_codon:yes stop_codon:yes gene_type:complete